MLDYIVFITYKVFSFIVRITPKILMKYILIFFAR